MKVLLALMFCSGMLLAMDPAQFGSTARIAIDWWTTKIGYVGNPNMLNRNDRTIVRFDLRRYLATGRVASARLSWEASITGCDVSNDIVVEQLTRWREKIGAQDVLSGDAVEITRMTVSDETSVPWSVSLDLTKLVNQLLSEGHPDLVLRFRDDSVEKRGQRKNAPECITIQPNAIRLDVKAYGAP